MSSDERKRDRRYECPYADCAGARKEDAMDERIRRIVRDELLKNGLIRHTSHPDDPSWM